MPAEKQEEIEGDFEYSEDLAENAAKMEKELDGLRELSAREETVRETRNERVENEKLHSIDGLMPDKNRQPIEHHPSKILINEDKINSTRVLYQNGVETYRDLSELSQDELDDLDVSGLDKDIVTDLWETSRELRDEIGSTAVKLDDEIDSDLDASDFQEVILQGTFDGASIDEMEERIKNNKRHIPGAEGEGASGLEEVYDATPVSNLSPIRDYDINENESSDGENSRGEYKHVQAESANVVGEVRNVVHSDKTSDGVYQKFWVEDNNGDQTIVTVFSDSLEFSEDSFTEDRDGSTATGDFLSSDMRETGIDERFSTVKVGDTVVVKNVIVDDNKYDGIMGETDGYTLTTTPSSELHVEETNNGMSGVELQNNEQAQQKRMETARTGDLPDPHSKGPDKTPFVGGDEELAKRGNSRVTDDELEDRDVDADI